MAETGLVPSDIQVYRQTAQARRQARQARVVARRARAWDVARQAAAVLKDEFGAGRVVLFGSLTGATRFHERSDIDLAVWNLDERLYYRAVARLLDLDPAISVDLVEFEHARPSLQAAIQREGVLL